SMWLTSWCTQHNLYIGLLSSDDTLSTVEGWNHSETALQALEKAREVWLELNPFCPSLSDVNGLMSANYDRFTIQHPRWVKQGLREALFGSLSTDPTHVKVWKTLDKDVRSRTKSGVWVVNPNDGSTVWSKQRRYSGDVSTLYQKGVTLRVFAGTNVVRLDTAPNL